MRRDRPLTLERAVERRALLSYATDEAGVGTPRLLALISVGSDATVLAHEQRAGTTLAQLAGVPDGSGEDEPGPDGSGEDEPGPAGSGRTARPGRNPAATPGPSRAGRGSLRPGPARPGLPGPCPAGQARGFRADR